MNLASNSATMTQEDSFEHLTEAMKGKT